eukprot:7113399-Pyramimonas_sp.AAC.1
MRIEDQPKEEASASMEEDGPEDGAKGIGAAVPGLDSTDEELEQMINEKFAQSVAEARAELPSA